MSAISNESRLRQNPRTASRVIEGHAVVIVNDAQALHRLTEVGTFVWERSDGRSVRQIVDELTAEYDVSDEVAAADVKRFAAELVELGALKVEP